MNTNTDGKMFAEVKTDSDLIRETFIRTVVLERICLELIAGFSTFFEDEPTVRAALMRTIRERFERDPMIPDADGMAAFKRSVLRNVDQFERTLLAYTGDAKKLAKGEKQ